MSYIIKIKGQPSKKEIQKIFGKEVFISEVLPIIIADNVDNALTDIEFIESIREEDYGTLQAVSIIPPIHERKMHYEGLTGFGQNVAIIDSGFNSKILDNRTIESQDFISMGNKDFTDYFGHGTAVGKIINKCAPGANLINLKVTNRSEVSEANIIKALEWVYLSNIVHIVNISAAIERKCNGECEICQFIKLLYEKGILVIAAAGNSGPQIGTIGCPANSHEAIAVGAINVNSKLADYSSRGELGQNKPDILSSGTYNSKNDTKKGTSFACPVVAGVSACIRTYFHDVNKLRTVICNSTTKIDGLESYEQGNGILDVDKILEVLYHETLLSKSL